MFINTLKYDARYTRQTQIRGKSISRRSRWNALWYSLPMTDKVACHVTGTHNAWPSPALQSAVEVSRRSTVNNNHHALQTYAQLAKKRTSEDRSTGPRPILKWYDFNTRYRTLKEWVVPRIQNREKLLHCLGFSVRVAPRGLRPQKCIHVPTNNHRLNPEISP